MTLKGKKIEFKKIGKDTRNNKFKKLRVFFGQNDSTYLMQLGVNDEVIDAEILPQAKNIAEHNFAIPLLAKDIEFSDNCVKNGINESFTRYISDDGVLLRPNHHPVVGKDSVIKLLNNKKKNNFTMRWKPSYACVAKSGELGYTYGVYELSGTAPDNTIISSNGTYVSIWKKDGSGNWKLALDSGNEGLVPVKKNK